MTTKADTAPADGQDIPGMLICALAACMLGLAVAVARYAYEGGANGIAVATMRSTIAAGGLFLWCLWAGRALRLPFGTWLHCAGNGVLFSMMSWGNIGSVEFIPVGLAALLFFTYPPMVAAIAAIMHREAMPPLKIASIALAFAGLVAMLGVSLGAADPRGIGMALLAAAGAAVNAIWIGRKLKHVNGLVLTMHVTAVAAVLLIVLSLVAGVFRLPHDSGGWAGLMGVVALQSAGIPLYFVALQRIGAVKGTMITNVQPVVSIVAAYLLFAELLTPLQFLGGAMVLGGIWLMQWVDTRRR